MELLNGLIGGLNKLELVAGDLAIGNPILGGVLSGSVLYANTSGFLAQDNANFSYDASTHTLSLNNLTASGQILAANGTADAPSYAFASQAMGWYRSSTSNMTFAVGSANFFTLDANGNIRIRMRSDATLSWTASTDSTGTPDTMLARDAANTLAQRNGSNAQAFRVYNTYTDASNGEWVETTWSGNVVSISTNKNGTGTVRDLKFATNGGNVGFGVAPSAKTHVLSTTEQLRLAYDATYKVSHTVGSTGIYTIAPTGGFVFAPLVRTSGSAIAFDFRIPADTTLAASVEAVGFQYSAATRQFSAGNLTTQRAIVVKAPTYTANGASTFTNVATLAIEGAPIASTNLTATNRYALWVQADNARFDGVVLASDGSAGAPSYGFASSSNTGFYLSSGVLIAASSGTRVVSFGGNGLFSDRGLINIRNISGADTVGVNLYSDGVNNTLALRNSTNAQTFNLYATYTDASNYERLAITFDSGGGGRFRLFTARAGSGSARSLDIGGDASNIYFTTNSAAAWKIDTSGHLSAQSNLNTWNGTSALATNATAGFLGVNSCAGTPTGTPASIPTGQKPMVFDSSNGILYLYDGSWKKPSANIATGVITWS